MATKKWTDEEVQTLKKMYIDEKCTVKEIAQKLGRTESSVRPKLTRVLDKKENNVKEWTDEEIQFLKFAYPNKEYSVEDILDGLKTKNRDQIYSKANTLGIKRYKETIPTGFKKCSRCNMILPLEDFWGDRSTKDGKCYWCKNCYTEMRKTKHSDTEEISIKTKKCTKCGKIKNIEEFYKNKRYKDGRYNLCKDCKNNEDRRRRILGGY